MATRSGRGCTGRGSSRVTRPSPPRPPVALDLYARVFDGKPLAADEFVICADEKTSIQCRCRCHPTLPPGRARMMRVEHEYERGGALAYLAAYDVHRAHVIGRCEPTTGIVPFGRLVEQVMTAEPYASAKRVFWIVDNGSSHRGQASIRATRNGVADAAADPPPGPRLLAGPVRDLLLDRATQSRQTQRLHHPRRDQPNDSPPFEDALQPAGRAVRLDLRA